MYKKLIYSSLLIIFCSSQWACSGNECAASNDFYDDIDSDCVVDTSDNCVGTYNPSQFDGDEDGVGAACDSNDTSDTEAGVYLHKESDFNLAGYYAVDGCLTSDEFLVEQDTTDITLYTDNDETLEGSAEYNTENLLITANIEGDEQDCELQYDIEAASILLSCKDLNGDECQAGIEKLQTHLK
jgi:hypothetical protein